MKISLRNLVRQKRRNLFLGIGIVFGVCILTITSAFSQGITDILVNRIIVWMTGHIQVKMSERYKHEWNIIRDKERIKQIIREHVEGDKTIYEVVNRTGRALGNDAIEFIEVLGLEIDEEFFQGFGFELVAGNISDIVNPNIENPIILYSKMAKNLNVQVKDTIHMQFSTVYGQVQTARFQVAAILKSTNPFMNTKAFVHLNILKSLLDYKAHETGVFVILLEQFNDPKYILAQANRLHAALYPQVAGYQGTIQAHGRQQEVQMVAVAPSAKSHRTFASLLKITEGSINDTLNKKDAALLSQAYADELGVGIGDQLTFSYKTKFEGLFPAKTCRISALFQPNRDVTDDMVFLHPEQMYTTFFPSPPQFPVTIPREHPLFPLLLKEWDLLERSPNREALLQKYYNIESSDWQGAFIDVQTMYEFASELLQIEQVIDLLSLIGVLILFIIVLIGVVNTLRMSIRERTREIGTVRAIGMQQKDIRWSFVLEVLFLAVFSSIVGIVLALILMNLLSLITFQAEESFLTICLENRHLYFLPTVHDIVQNFLLIVTITMLTAYFPARRASKMSVARALRYYE